MGVYAEPTENGTGLNTFRALFPGQTVQGLSKVPFQKPSLAPVQKNQPLNTMKDEDTVSFETSTLSSTYEAPEVPQHSLPSVNQPAFERPTIPTTMKPMASSQDSRYQQYQLPPLDMLDSRSAVADIEFNEQITKQRVDILNQKFMALGIEATIVDYQIGPAVTAFDVKMDEGAQISQVRRVLGDLAVALGGFPMSLKELVPGKTVSHLEVLNERISMVGYKELMEDLRNQPLFKNKFALPFGRNILGEVIALTPKEIIHLLVAGSSGSGKTVFVHSFLTSIILSTTPKQARILLIDPKKFELSKYKNHPQVLSK